MRNYKTSNDTENIFFQHLKTLARRSMSQSLIRQVDALEGRGRSDLAIVGNSIALASRGDIDPESLNLEQIIVKYRQNEKNNTGYN